MIKTEILADGRIRHYSDLDYFIRQIETNILYKDAVDIQPCRYTYEETDISASELTAEEALNISVGSEIE